MFVYHDCFPFPKFETQGGYRVERCRPQLRQVCTRICLTPHGQDHVGGSLSVSGLSLLPNIHMNTMLYKRINMMAIHHSHQGTVHNATTAATAVTNMIAVFTKHISSACLRGGPW